MRRDYERKPEQCKAGTSFERRPVRCELLLRHLSPTHVGMVTIDGHPWWVYWGGPLPDGIVPDKVVVPVDDEARIPDADLAEAARLRDATPPTQQIAAPDLPDARKAPSPVEPERKDLAPEPPQPPPARRRTKGRIY